MKDRREKLPKPVCIKYLLFDQMADKVQLMIHQGLAHECAYLGWQMGFSLKRTAGSAVSSFGRSEKVR